MPHSAPTVAPHGPAVPRDRRSAAGRPRHGRSRHRASPDPPASPRHRQGRWPVPAPDQVAVPASPRPGASGRPAAPGRPRPAAPPPASSGFAAAPRGPSSCRRSGGRGSAAHSCRSASAGRRSGFRDGPDRPRRRGHRPAASGSTPASGWRGSCPRSRRGWGRAGSAAPARARIWPLRWSATIRAALIPAPAPGHWRAAESDARLQPGIQRGAMHPLPRRRRDQPVGQMRGPASGRPAQGEHRRAGRPQPCRAAPPPRRCGPAPSPRPARRHRVAVGAARLGRLGQRHQRRGLGRGQAARLLPEPREESGARTPSILPPKGASVR